jgi:hypothetical protein
MLQDDLFDEKVTFVPDLRISPQPSITLLPQTLTPFQPTLLEFDLPATVPSEPEQPTDQCRRKSSTSLAELRGFEMDERKSETFPPHKRSMKRSESLRVPLRKEWNIFDGDQPVLL